MCSRRRRDSVLVAAAVGVAGINAMRMDETRMDVMMTGDETRVAAAVDESLIAASAPTSLRMNIKICQKNEFEMIR